MNYNRCIFIGNLTRDPETRTVGSGSTVCSFGIAVNNPRAKDETLYIKVDTWNRTAEIAQQYLRKGSLVLVEGRIRLDEFTGRDGEKRQSLSLTADNFQMAPRGTSSSGGYEQDSSGGGGYDRGAGYDRGGSSAGSARESYDQPSAQEQYDRRREFDDPAQSGGSGGEGTEDDLPF